jgi:hypothetical protein
VVGRRRARIAEAARGILHQIQVAEHRAVTEQDRAGAVPFGRMEEMAWPTAHHGHQPVHAAGEPGMAAQGQLEIGQRAEAQDREWSAIERLLESGGQRGLRRRLAAARVGGALALSRAGRHRRTAVYRHRHALRAKQGRQVAGDAVGHLERCVAEHGGDPRQLDAGRPREQQDGEAVVGIGGAGVAAGRVGIDPDASRHIHDGPTRHEEERRHGHLAGAPAADRNGRGDDQQRGEHRRGERQPPEHLGRPPTRPRAP